MSVTTPANEVEIERLIAEADASLDRRDAANLVKQAAVIAKISSLTAHHKSRITAYYRFLSEDLQSKKSTAASVMPTIEPQPPARHTGPLRPLAQPVVPGRTPAIKKEEPDAVEETGIDDSDFVCETIDAQELLDVLIDDPDSKPKLLQALKPHCEAIAKMTETDEKTLLELLRKIAVDSKGNDEEGKVDHYQVRLMLQLIALRRQMDDDLRDKMIETVDTVMYSNDADDE